MMTKADAIEVEERRAREKVLVDKRRRARLKKEKAFLTCSAGCGIPLHPSRQCPECGADLVWRSQNHMLLWEHALKGALKDFSENATMKGIPLEDRMLFLMEFMNTPTLSWDEFMKMQRL